MADDSVLRGKIPFNVQDADWKPGLDQHKIHASSFEEIVREGKTKLQIPDTVNVSVVREEDRTKVIEETDDEYLVYRPLAQLVFLKPGESWSGDSMVIKVLNEISQPANRNKAVMEVKEKLSQNNLSKEAKRILRDFCKAFERKEYYETRKEDKEWFKGVRSQTKCSHMKFLARTRMTSYYCRAKKHIKEEMGIRKERFHVLDTLDKAYELVKQTENHEFLFDRKCGASSDSESDPESETERRALCSAEGLFHCQGPSDGSKCEIDNCINPYASFYYRKQFSWWNLDHKIELIKGVVDVLIQAGLRLPHGNKLDEKVLYKYLFTRENLQFVCPECHGKGRREHKLTVVDFYTDE